MLMKGLAAAVGTSATTLAQGGSLEIPWLRIGLVLVLCIALAIAAIGFVRLRYGMPFLPERLGNPVRLQTPAPGEEERLKILERLSAGPTSQFIILARGKQRYLLHVSQQGVTEIDRFGEDDSEDSNDGASVP